MATGGLSPKEITFLIKVQDQSRAAIKSFTDGLGGVGKASKDAGAAVTELGTSSQVALRKTQVAADSSALSFAKVKKSVVDSVAQMGLSYGQVDKLVASSVSTMLAAENAKTAAVKEGALVRDAVWEKEAHAQLERENIQGRAEQAIEDARLAAQGSSRAGLTSAVSSAAPAAAVAAGSAVAAGGAAAVTDVETAAAAAKGTELGVVEARARVAASKAAVLADQEKPESDPNKLGAIYAEQAAAQEGLTRAHIANNAAQRELAAAQAAVAASGQTETTVLGEEAVASERLIIATQKLIDQYDKTGVRLALLKTQQADYNAAVKAGILSDEESALIKGGLAKGFADIEDGAKKSGTQIHGLSGIIRETLVVFRELGRGDTTRLVGSLTILGQKFGLVEGAVAAVGGAAFIGFGIAVAGAVAFAAASAAGSVAATRFNNTLALTGNYAGLTADSYQAMATAIEANTGRSIASNEGFILSLAKTNQFTRDEVQSLVTSGEQLASATGEDAKDIIGSFAKMGEGPSKFAEEFQRSYAGIITPLQVQAIQELEERGRKEQATALLVKDIQDGIATNLTKNTNIIVSGWHSAITAISDYLGYLERVASGTTTNTDKIAKLNGEIAGLQKPQSAGVTARFGDINPNRAAELADAIKQRDALVAQDKAAQAVADKQGQTNRAVQDGVDAHKALQTEIDKVTDRTTAYGRAQDATKEKIRQEYAAANEAAKAHRSDAAALLALADADKKATSSKAFTDGQRKEYEPRAVAAEKKDANAAERAAHAAALKDERDFQSELKKLQTTYAPDDHSDTEYDKGTAAITRALASTDAELAKSGVTRAQLATIQENLNRKHLEFADALFKEQRSAEQANAILAVAPQYRSIETKVIEAQNAALDKNRALTDEQVQALRALLTQEAANAAFDSARNSLQGQGEDLNRELALTTQTGGLRSAQLAVEKQIDTLRKAGNVDEQALATFEAESLAIAREKATLAAQEDLTGTLRQMSDQVQLAGVLAKYRDDDSKLLEYNNKLAQDGLVSDAERNRLVGIYAQGLEDARKAAVAATKDTNAGLHEGLEQINSDWTDMRKQTTELVTSTFQSLQTHLTDFLTTGKGGFKEMFADLGKQLTGNSVKNALGSVAGGLDSLLGGKSKTDQPGFFAKAIGGAKDLSPIDLLAKSIADGKPIPVNIVSGLGTGTTVAGALGGLGKTGAANDNTATSPVVSGIATMLGIKAPTGTGKQDPSDALAQQQLAGKPIPVSVMSGLAGAGGAAGSNPLQSILGSLGGGTTPGAGGGLSSIFGGFASDLAQTNHTDSAGDAITSATDGLGGGGSALAIPNITGDLTKSLTAITSGTDAAGSSFLGGFSKVLQGIVGGGGSGAGGGLAGIGTMLGGLLGNAIGGKTGKAIGSVLGGLGGSYLGSLFADGGIMTQFGSVPLQKYSGGGIARSPQLAMFGEGSSPEAYVPVPSGRIPVELSGSMGGVSHSTTNMTVVAQDANSFRRSIPQIQTKYARGLARQSKRNG